MLGRFLPAFGVVVIAAVSGGPFLTFSAPVAVDTPVQREPPTLVSRPPQTGPQPVPGIVKARVPPLFPFGRVTDESKISGVIAFIRDTFRDKSVLAVDLVRYGDPKPGTILHALAAVPKELGIATQVLPRQRDGRFRLRVLRNFPVDEDSGCDVFSVSKNTDHKKLARAMVSRLKTNRFESSNSAKATVKLQLIGNEAAERATSAIEELFWESRREITFVVTSAPVDPLTSGLVDTREDAGLYVSVTSS